MEQTMSMFGVPIQFSMSITCVFYYILQEFQAINSFEEWSIEFKVEQKWVDENFAKFTVFVDLSIST